MSRPLDDLDAWLERGYRYALALAHDRTEAEDLVHEAALGLVKHGGPWHQGYFFAAIRNKFIDACRRAGKRLEQAMDERQREEIADESAAEALNMVVEAEQIERLLADLTPAQREALYLMAVEDYTAAEVAELTGQARGTVLSHVRRARMKLHVRLGRSHTELLR